jgi:TRAP transporter TAXI family solute receptor
MRSGGWAGRIVLCVLVVTVAATLMAGCARPGAEKPQEAPKESAPAPAPAPAAPAKKTDIAIGTGSTGGLYFIWMNAIVKLINDKTTTLQASPESVSGSGNTVRLVHSHDLDFGGAGLDIAFHGYDGSREFTEKYQNIRAAWCLPPSGQVLVVLKSSKIQTIQDLKGKTIGVNSASGQSQVEFYLEKHGLKKGDYTMKILTYTESAQALRDKTIDASCQVIAPPAGALTDLATTTGVRVLYMDKSAVEAVAAERKYWPALEAPANSIQGQDKPAYTFPMLGLVICNKDVPDDIVYTVVKTIAENNDELAKSHPQLKEANADLVKRTIEQGAMVIPIHPGAEKYFREVGIMK